jgi:GNAT superfamily N-acetyltransferase
MPPDEHIAHDHAACWRAMAVGDLPAVSALSSTVHPKHPERPEVLDEKFRLHPRGCFVLASGQVISEGQVISGYCFSHPWTRDAVPALDTFLGRLPERPTTYYVHDLTLDETLRGQGLGRAIVPLLFECACFLGIPHLSLVAVNRRGPFWQAAGFSMTADAALQAAVRKKYGEGAVHMERQL